jgi:hypothetical protein
LNPTFPIWQLRTRYLRRCSTNVSNTCPAVTAKEEDRALRRQKRRLDQPGLIAADQPGYIFGATVVHPSPEILDLRGLPLFFGQGIQPFWGVGLRGDAWRNVLRQESGQGSVCSCRRNRRVRIVGKARAMPPLQFLSPLRSVLDIDQPDPNSDSQTLFKSCLLVGPFVTGIGRPAPPKSWSWSLCLPRSCRLEPAVA